MKFTFFLRGMYGLLRESASQATLHGYWRRKGFGLHPTCRLYLDNDANLIIRGRVSTGCYSIFHAMKDAHPGAAASVLEVGDRTHFGDHVNIRASGGKIEIGHSCLIANGTTIVASNHGTASGICILDQPWDTRVTGVFIGDDVWIGAGVVVLPGSRIDSGAVVAAGAVVRGVVSPYAIVAGIPATQKGVRPSAAAATSN